jgi:hypothetical protein
MRQPPILQFHATVGPPLIFGEVTAPALNLQTPSTGPSLNISPSEQATGHHLSNVVPALVFIVLGCLVSAVTVPLSQGSQWARLPIDQWMANMAELTPPWINPEEASETPPLASVELEETAETHATTGNSPLVLLNGVNCSAYLPGDKPSVASSAFDEHIWSKLPKETQDQAVQRLDVCTPFEVIKQDLIAAQGCAQHECGTNDVRFYLSADNKAAIEINVDGQCTHSAESGFMHTELLCARR